MRSLFRHFLSKYVALVLALMTIAPGAVVAKDDAVLTPKNAQTKSYGSGWECIRGFRESKGKCAKIKIPPNAYPTRYSFGRLWDCKRGFKSRSEACVAVKVPADGYLAPYGDRWECNRGFIATEKECVAVVVPANAHLDFSGARWECDRSYEEKQGKCVEP